jgi:rhodanese-related sulfurtransferase
MVALQMLGYDARNLSGGINSWLAEDYPVVGAAEAAEGDAGEGDMVVEIPLPEGTPLDAEVVGPLAFEAAVTLAGEAGFGTITEETRQADYADAYLLDVREVSEYEGGFIPGAVNVPLREVAQNLYLLPEDQSAPIVVYCAAGHRGAIAEIALELLGYDNVTSLRSGIRAYTGELSNDVPATGMHAFPEIDPDLWASVDAYLTSLPAGFYGISAEDLALGLTEGKLTVIDVREPSEYEGGAIEGAINVPLRSFTEQLDQLPAQDTPIVLYGSIGHRSALAMVAMQMAGFEDVRSFAGGSGGWTAAGYELVTP